MINKDIIQYNTYNIIEIKVLGDAGTHLCVVCTQVCRHTPVGTSVAGASPSLMGTDC